MPTATFAAVKPFLARIVRHIHVCVVQVPSQIFITKALPKTATGKIQRRFMVGHFIGDGSQKAASGQQGSQQPRSKL